MSDELRNCEILVGVTGGIAAYKTAVLVSRFVAAGAGVSVIMTESARHLVAPKTFEALTGRRVGLDLWNDSQSYPHIETARAARIFCIVPATANFMAKAAHGIADDLLSSVYLAFDGPVIMAPAMNSVMWEKPAVCRNLRQLDEDGVIFIGPDSGRLGCGESGMGRMAETDVIYAAVRRVMFT